MNDHGGIIVFSRTNPFPSSLTTFLSQTNVSQESQRESAPPIEQPPPSYSPRPKPPNSTLHVPYTSSPLWARENGVLTRDGHTEAAVDFARLAGCSPVGLLCKIVSEEEPVEMARLPELKRFCKRRGYVLTSIVDLQQYRRDTESLFPDKE